MVQGLVSGRTLHDFARGLHMQRHLALDVSSQWEAKHLFGWADGMLADSFEALLAALFLDRGHRAANSLIMRLIKVSLPCGLMLNGSVRPLAGPTACLLTALRLCWQRYV